MSQHLLGSDRPELLTGFGRVRAEEPPLKAASLNPVEAPA
jgi:hypothetical protein